MSCATCADRAAAPPPCRRPCRTLPPPMPPTCRPVPLPHCRRPATCRSAADPCRRLCRRPCRRQFVIGSEAVGVAFGYVASGDGTRIWRVHQRQRRTCAPDGEQAQNTLIFDQLQRNPKPIRLRTIVNAQHVNCRAAPVLRQIAGRIVARAKFANVCDGVCLHVNPPCPALPDRTGRYAPSAVRLPQRAAGRAFVKAVGL